MSRCSGAQCSSCRKCARIQSARMCLDEVVFESRNRFLSLAASRAGIKPVFGRRERIWAVLTDGCGRMRSDSSLAHSIASVGKRGNRRRFRYGNGGMHLRIACAVLAACAFRRFIPTEERSMIGTSRRFFWVRVRRTRRGSWGHGGNTTERRRVFASWFPRTKW